MQKALATAVESRAALVKELEPRLVALFEQVAKARKGVALCSATRDGLCSVCHVRLRPAVFQQVRHNDTHRAVRQLPADPLLRAAAAARGTPDRPDFVNQLSLFGPAGGRSAIAHIDGGSRGNPGPAGYGVHIEQDDGTIVELKESLGVATNNVAEYSGLLAALRWAAAHGLKTAARPVRFRAAGQADEGRSTA